MRLEDWGACTTCMSGPGCVSCLLALVACVCLDAHVFLLDDDPVVHLTEVR